MRGAPDDAAIDDLRQLILRGATLRMGFARGVRVWWVDHPYVEVDDATVASAAVGHNGAPLLAEAGDCLFGWRGNSQTWRSVYAD